MSLRTEKEMKSLFDDKKFARQAWKSVGMAILQNPAVRLPPQVDKEGNTTLQSELENYSYGQLARDIKQLGEKDRAPTELEMILQCQIVKARWDTSAAVFVRDTLGAKPVDETKLEASMSNPYEDLTDEELMMIAEIRQQKALQAAAEQSLPVAPEGTVAIVTLPAKDEKVVVTEYDT
jgi:hypothetical protein